MKNAPTQEYVDELVNLNSRLDELGMKCEKYLIAKYKSNIAKYGYNNSLGGESGSYGHILTQEQRKKISDSNKGRIVSEETRKKIGQANSIALKGRVVPEEVRRKISKHSTKPFLGKHHTEEAKRKNSEAHKGKQYHLGFKHSEETKRKISEVKKGKPLSEAQKAQLKRLHEHNTGLKRTPEQIENIKAARRRTKIEAEC